MASTLRVLIVEDDENDALLLARQLRKGGLEVEFQRVDTEAAMAAACDARTWDVVISDVSMPRFTAAAALALVRQRQGDCPFIVVSGVIDEEMAVSLLRSGAHDFILKGRLARLVPAVERELREWHTRRARHEAEEARRVSEERYALAARGANDGIWDWDVVAGAVYLSPRWKGILGHGDDEIGTAPEEWLDRIHPDNRAGVRAGIAAHLAQEVPHLAVEHRLRHRDGGWRWVLARGVAVRHEDGTPCRMAGSLTDITAGKQAEQALRQAKDELEGALMAKTRFLAAASHDLRQPFQSMRLYQHMLAEKVVDSVQQRLAANLGEAMAAG
jgi:PAS domain S-box-containing protein